MAYKFQIGPAQLSGALTQEGAITAEGLASLDGGINVNSSNFTVSTAGAVVAESTVSGAAATFDSIAGTSLALQDGGITNAGDISGSALTMNALAGTSLALQSGGITAAGAIAGASTISGSDTLSISHVDIDGTIDAAAGAFTVSAAGNMVALSASVSTLYGSGNAQIAGQLRLEDAFTMDNASISDAGAISGALAISGLSLDIEAGADIDGALTVGAGNAFSVGATGNLIACPSASIVDLYVSDDAHFVDTVLVEGAFSASAGLHITNGMGLIVGSGGEAQIDAAGTLSTSGDISGSAFFINAGSDAEIAQNWLPDVDNTLDLGSSSKRWSNIYVENVVGAVINLETAEYTSATTIGAAVGFALANFSSNLQLDLPAGADGKVVRIKSINDGVVSLSASVAGEEVFDEINGDLIELETKGAAVTCVFKGSSGAGKWYII